jgi:hypothetical protein
VRRGFTYDLLELLNVVMSVGLFPMAGSVVHRPGTTRLSIIIIYPTNRNFSF